MFNFIISKSKFNSLYRIGFPPPYRHKAFQQNKQPNHRLSFTLAETLITLTIIGIVAAMTVPTLMQNYKRHLLESQFKQAHSLIQNANLAMQIDYPTIYEDIRNIATSSNLQDAYADHLDKLAEYMPKAELSYEHKSYSQIYDSFVKGSYAHIDADSLTTKAILLPNGALIFMGPWGAYGYHIDINGPNKGPNRLGHDLFSFNIDPTNNNIVPYTKFGGCMTSDKEHYQGFTCAKWAIINQCESDPKKTYWECINP